MEVDLGANFAEVNGRIEKAAAKSGRSARDIKMVAVTKTVELKRIKETVDRGLRILGENRVQEMLEKVPTLPGDVEWHMIGRLQRNKVKHIIGKVGLIQSLDRWSLAEEIQKRAQQNDTIVPVLVQLNLAGEDTKSGLAGNELLDFLTEAVRLDHISVGGLMTIAPFTDDPEEVRPVFREMRKLANEMQGTIPGVKLDYLSMGMTNDFEIAIEEGANMVRIGSALFGSRVIKGGI